MTSAGVETDPKLHEARKAAMEELAKAKEKMDRLKEDKKATAEVKASALEELTKAKEKMDRLRADKEKTGHVHDAAMGELLKGDAIDKIKELHEAKENTKDKRNVAQDELLHKVKKLE